MAGITIKEMHDYGYTWDGMLPLTPEQAKELYPFHPIFKLHADDAESLIEDIEEITDDYIYGIEKEEYTVQ